MSYKFLFAAGCCTSAAASEAAVLLQASAHKFGTLNNASAYDFANPAMLTQVRNLRQTIESGQEFSVREISDMDDLITMLDDEFMPVIATQNAGDQIMFDEARIRLYTCIGNQENRLNGATSDLALYDAEVLATGLKHRACKLTQAALAPYQTAADGVSQSQWAAMTGADDTAVHDDSLLCDLRDVFDTALTTYQNLVPAGHVSSSCVDDQIPLEVAYCNRLHAFSSTCASFEECTAAVGLSVIKASIEADILIRRTIHYDIQVVKCHLRRLDKENPDRRAIVCDNTTVPAPPPSLYQLDLTIPENVTTCEQNTTDDFDYGLRPSLVDSTACAAWRAHQYVDVVVDTCQFNCMLPSAEAAPNPNCVDNHDPQNICPFYDLHTPACGFYPDNSSVACCSCGGGTATR